MSIGRIFATQKTKWIGEWEALLSSLGFVFGLGFVGQHPWSGVIVDAHLGKNVWSMKPDLRLHLCSLWVLTKPGTNSKLDIATMSSTKDRKGCSRVVENLELSQLSPCQAIKGGQDIPAHFVNPETEHIKQRWRLFILDSRP